MKETFDLASYYFHQGTNFTSYAYFGAHLVESSPSYRYVFRTWAPNAASVFLVGDFISWDDGLSMERITEGGIYELFVESDTSLEGALYKFLIVTKDARKLLKGMKGIIYEQKTTVGESVLRHLAHHKASHSTGVKVGYIGVAVATSGLQGKE